MSDLKKRLSSQLESIDTPAEDVMSGGGFHLQRAAVLIACQHSQVPQVILTVRTHTMPHHAGQVSLPGGRPQVGETFPMETAIREAEEEIGLSRDSVEIMGQLAPVQTVTGFEISPVVAWVDGVVKLRPCDREVAEIFHLPLPHILDHQHYCAHTLYQGSEQARKSHEIWSLRGTHWPIWGATALILARLAGVSERGLSAAPDGAVDDRQ